LGQALKQRPHFTQLDLAAPVDLASWSSANIGQEKSQAPQETHAEVSTAT
jgi:hypothetical protein